MSTLITPSVGTYFQNGLRTDTNKTAMLNLYGTGAPLSPRAFLYRTPFFDGTTATTGGAIANAVYISSALTTFTSSTTSMPFNQNANLVTYQGVQAYKLDCLRKVIVTQNTVGPSVNTAFMTVTGFDDRGIAVTSRSSSVVNNNAHGIIATSGKCFLYVTSITFSADPTNGTGAYTAGVSNTFGSPLYFPYVALGSAATVGGSSAPFTAATTTTGVNFYTQSYGGSDTQNAALADARGSFSFPEQQLYDTAVKGPSIIISIASYGADAVFQAQLQDPTLVTSFSAGGRTYTAPDNFLTNTVFGTNPGYQRPNSMGNALTSFDLTGVQFPGDTGSIAVPGSQASSLYQQTFPS